MTTEYLRRNLLHCKSIGAHGIAVSSLERLLRMKNPPVWIVAAFEGVRDRTAELPKEMAAWRNSAPDAPTYAADGVPVAGKDGPPSWRDRYTAAGVAVAHGKGSRPNPSEAEE